MALNSNLETPGPARHHVELPVQALSASVLTFEHPLGVVPGNVSVRLRAKVAATYGVEKGMEFDLNHQDGDRDNSHSAITSVWLSDTKVILKLALDQTRWMPDGTEIDYNIPWTAAGYDIVVRVSP